MVTMSKDKLKETDLKDSEQTSTITDNANSDKKNAGAKSHKNVSDNASLFRYENSNSEFFDSLSIGQQLKAHNFLAIDIDSDKIRFLTGKAAGQNIHAKKWGVQVAQDYEKNRQKGIKLILDNISTQHYKAGYKVYISFFSPDVTFRQFVLPKVKKLKELTNAIYFKLQADLPGFNENSKWRYKIIDEFSENGVKYIRIVVFVVPDESISNLIELLDSAGLRPETLIPRSVASSHAFNRMIHESKSDVLVDISYDITHLNFISDSELEYARNIASGASNLEVAVHDKKGKILGPDSISINEEDGIGKNGATRPDKIRQSLKSRLKLLQAQQNPVLQLFKNELQNSIDYFNNLNKDKEVKRIFLAGYGIQKESLLSFLKENMKLPVFVLSPKLEKTQNNALQFGQFFSTIGTIIKPNNPFNLIPKSYRNNQKFKRLNYLVILVFIFLVIGLGYVNNVVNLSVDAVRNQLDNIENQYKKLNPVETEYQRVLKEIQSTKNEQARLGQILNEPGPIVNIMKFISNETPQQIVLHELSVFPEKISASSKKRRVSAEQPKIIKKSYTIKISGNVVSDYLMSDITLINYIDHLKNLKFFKSIEISQKYKKSDNQIFSFEIKATL